MENALEPFDRHSSAAGNPAPLVSADCDLRGSSDIPLDIQWFQQVFLPMHAATGTVHPAMRLWLAAWQQFPSGSLPNDDAALCAMAGYPRFGKAFQKDRERLLRGWVLCADDRWYHPVLAEKVSQVAVARAQRSRSARVAAKARWTATREEGETTGQTSGLDGSASIPKVDASRMRDACATHGFATVDANETGGSTTSDSKDVSTKEPEKPRRKPARKPDALVRAALLGMNLPDGLSLDAWARFVDFRFDIKKPLTLHAGDLALRELEKLRKAGNAPEDVIAQSIISGWSGLFPVRKGFSARGGLPRRESAGEGASTSSGPAITAL